MMTIRRHRELMGPVVKPYFRNKWSNLLKRYIQITSIGNPRYLIKTGSSSPDIAEFVTGISWENDTTIILSSSTQNKFKSIDPKHIIGMKLLRNEDVE